MQKIIDYVMKFFITLTIVLAVLAFVRPDLVKAFIEWIRTIVDLLGNWNYLVVFLSGMIESFPVLWIIVPWQNILLIAGWFFWESDIVKLLLVICSASLWAIVWNYVWYVLWKKYGKRFFQQYGLWFGIGETEVEYLEKWIKKWWPIWIVLWKFHNLARAFIPFIAGSMGMKSRKFMIYNTIWSILRALIIVLLWVLFAKTYETFIDYLEYFFIWLIVLIWLYIYVFKRNEFKIYMQKKNQEIEKRMMQK